MNFRYCLLAAVVSISLSTSGQAQACSGTLSRSYDPEFFPARRTVPANLPAVLFWELWEPGDQLQDRQAFPNGGRVKPHQRALWAHPGGVAVAFGQPIRGGALRPKFARDA